MKGFLEIDQISMPKEYLNEAIGFLRYAGSKHVEGVALFAGKASETSFEILETICPNQKSYQLEYGLMYAVESEELHRINVWLYENDMQLIAQIHSHPTVAYHSETDDRYPIVDTVGGVSIVVPNFGMGAVDLHDWAIYRLSETPTWDELTENEIETLFTIK